MSDETENKTHILNGAKQQQTPEAMLRTVKENAAVRETADPSAGGAEPALRLDGQRSPGATEVNEPHSELSNASIHGGRSVIGVDVGERTLKLVHLQTSGSGIRLVGAEVTELPPKSDPDRFEVVSKSVKKFVAGAKPRPRAACCAMSGDGVATVCCSMPKMSEKDLARAVRWKVADAGSVDVERAAVGHYVLNAERKSDSVDVVVAAVPQDIGRMDVLFPADRPRLSVVVSGPIAAENIVMAAYHAQERGPVAVLDIGTASSNLSVVGEHGLEFTRQIPVGGDTVTAALSGKISFGNDTVEVSRRAADEVKRRYTIGQTGSVEVSGITLPANRILGAIRPVLERMASEVVRSLQFCAQSHGLARVESLFICGGSATLGGLAEYLTGQMRIPTAPLDPWRMLGFEVAPGIKSDPALFAVATGAAIHNSSKVNLLPARIKSRRIVLAIRTASLVATAASIFTLIALSLTAKKENSELEHVLLLKRQTATPMERAADKIAAAQKYQRELARRRGILRSLGAGNPIHAAILNELSNIMPEGTYLRSLSFVKADGPRKMRLNVEIYSVPTASAVRLKRQLIASIENSPFFTNVSFEPSRTDGRRQAGSPDESLDLTCQVLGSPGD